MFLYVRAFVLIFVLMQAACCEMVGNDARIVDGTDRPLLHTPDYRVQSGDTLYSIAFAADKDFMALATINHLKPPYHLKKGQTIRLSTVKHVSLPKPSHQEQARINLLEPDYQGLSKKHQSVELPAPDTKSLHNKHHKKRKKHLKNRGKHQSHHHLKTASKTRQSVSIVKHQIKKRSQVKKNSKVIKSVADNSSRHSKLQSQSHTVSKRILKPSVNTKPVNHWHWPTRGKVIGTFDSGRVGNRGLDITGKLGSPIRAAADGVVVYSGSGLRGYGNLIIVKHNTRFLSAYAYNQELLVKEGTEVKAGQVIAKMGQADSGIVKLHFEIRRAGKPVDPKRYLG